MNNSDTEDQLYDVEKILDYNEDTHEFLVRWTGFEGKDSWEPVKNLNCPILISEYFMEQDYAKKCKSKSVQTKDTNENDNQSFIQIFKKGIPKEVFQTEVYNEIMDIPSKIENIDIQSKEAHIFSSSSPDLVTVPLDWLTDNFPSLVNQYFLDKAKNLNPV